MRDFAARRMGVCRLLPIIVLALVSCSGISSATAQPQRTTPVTAWPDLAPLYNNIGQSFWDAERQLQERVPPFSPNPSPYKSPLKRSDPLYHKYFEVEQMANEYIQFLDDRKKGSQKSPFLKGDLGGFFGESWTLPPTLYLGGIAAFTIGDYASAQKYFSRLLENHADYKRYSYIGDNYTPDPDFSQPAKPGITKLLFYCQTVGAHGGALTKPSPLGRGLGEGKDPFAIFSNSTKPRKKYFYRKKHLPIGWPIDPINPSAAISSTKIMAMSQISGALPYCPKHRNSSTQAGRIFSLPH